MTHCNHICSLIDCNQQLIGWKEPPNYGIDGKRRKRRRTAHSGKELELKNF